jgi:hypothetical protein
MSRWLKAALEVWMKRGRAPPTYPAAALRINFTQKALPAPTIPPKVVKITGWNDAEVAAHWVS